MSGTDPVRSLRTRVRAARPAQMAMAAFAGMALFAGTWIAYGSAPARAVVGQSALAFNPRVALLYGVASNTVCTGVLISSTEIMTAGHCIESGKSDGTIGSTNALDPTVTRFKVTGGRTWATDPELGVVSITPEVTGITPATVDTTEMSPSPGLPVGIFGYGKSGTPGCGPNLCESDYNLREWNAEVQPPATCTVSLTDGEVCMTPVTDTIANGCIGDSGGPVFNRNTGSVIGVFGGPVAATSWCSAHEPGLFASTAGAQQFLFG